MPCPWHIVEGEPLVLGGQTKTVHQRFDNEYVTTGAGMDKVTEGHVIGALTCSAPEGCAIALRDFWQQYPKALSVTDNGVDIDLCPDLPLYADHYFWDMHEAHWSERDAGEEACCLSYTSQWYRDSIIYTCRPLS